VDNNRVAAGACGDRRFAIYYAPFSHDEVRRRKTMKADIHPNYADIKVTCSCGNEFTTRSTLGEDLLIEVCSSCHPFYTGKQKIVDSGGRVDKFRRKYGMS
jgi:large subunit ribosomal protein L31